MTAAAARCAARRRSRRASRSCRACRVHGKLEGCCVAQCIQQAQAYSNLTWRPRDPANPRGTRDVPSPIAHSISRVGIRSRGRTRNRVQDHHGWVIPKQLPPSSMRSVEGLFKSSGAGMRLHRLHRGHALLLHTCVAPCLRRAFVRLVAGPKLTFASASLLNHQVVDRLKPKPFMLPSVVNTSVSASAPSGGAALYGTCVGHGRLANAARWP